MHKQRLLYSFKPYADSNLNLSWNNVINAARSRYSFACIVQLNVKIPPYFAIEIGHSTFLPLCD